MCKLGALYQHGALHYHSALHYHGADNHPGATRHPSTEGNFLNFFDQGKEFKQFPSAEGWQAKPDGVVALSHKVFPRSDGVVEQKTHDQKLKQ